MKQHLLFHRSNLLFMLTASRHMLLSSQIQAWETTFLLNLAFFVQQHVALSPFPKGVLQGSASEIRGRFERRNPQFDPCSIERPFVPLQSSALCIGLAASGGKRCRKQGFILLLTIGSSSVLWCLHCPKVFECKAHT